MQEVKKHLEELLGQEEQSVQLEEMEIFEEADENGNEGSLIFNVDEKFYYKYSLSFNDVEWFEIKDDDGPEGNGQGGNGQG